ncbi:MAG: hypothetical protein QGD96_01360 [Anaerolineae bacterium]|nr:hypothetical protein [Anaerolineae bacterium]
MSKRKTLTIVGLLSAIALFIIGTVLFLNQSNLDQGGKALTNRHSRISEPFRFSLAAECEDDDEAEFGASLEVDCVEGDRGGRDDDDREGYDDDDDGIFSSRGFRGGFGRAIGPMLFLAPALLVVAVFGGAWAFRRARSKPNTFTNDDSSEGDDEEEYGKSE